MTTAVCFKCGKMKSGPFLPCESCQALPRDEEEIAISLALTDQYLELATLMRVGVSIANGKPPELDEQSHAHMLELIRGREDHSSEAGRREPLPRLDGADQLRAKVRKRWWRLW